MSGIDRIAVATTPRRSYSQVLRAYIYGAIALTDALLVTLCFLLADVVRHGAPTDAGNPSFLLIVPVFVASAFFCRCYSYAHVTSARRGGVQVGVALTGAVATTLILVFALKSSEDVSRVAFFVGAGLSFAMLVAIRVPLSHLVARLGPRFMRRILVDDGSFMGPVPHAFETVDVAALGIVPDLDDPMMLHRFSQLVSGADRVVVACPIERRSAWTIYLKSVDCAGELLLPELRGIELLHADARSGLSGVAVSRGSFDIRNRVLKRLFDLGLTVPAIILLSPIMIAAAIAIAIESGRPILFRQNRMGRGNQLFGLLKFRSMRTDAADHDGARSTARGDDRVTRVGRFIRATSIDELPQLFNVIDGDMSLVGPRPHALGSLAGDRLFWHVDQRYWLRHTIKPGLTGLAQVRGHRGATHHSDDLVKRLQSDLDYMTYWSPLRDLAILIRTIAVLVHNRAY